MRTCSCTQYVRIVEAFIGDRTLTTSQLAAELEDVPPGSLYRHVARLTRAGVLQVVAKRRVRGAVERTYTLRPAAAQIQPGEARAMSRDEHTRAFLAYVAGLLGDVDAYLATEPPDPAAGAGYRAGHPGSPTTSSPVSCSTCGGSSSPASPTRPVRAVAAGCSTTSTYPLPSQHQTAISPHMHLGKQNSLRHMAVIIARTVNAPLPATEPPIVSYGRNVPLGIPPRAPRLEGEALAAVRHRGSHLQIIASAGSGKTEVVSQRVVDLLADGVPAEAIVAFTFTERAAAELKERIARRVSPSGSAAALWTGSAACSSARSTPTASASCSSTCRGTRPTTCSTTTS